MRKANVKRGIKRPLILVSGLLLILIILLYNPLSLRLMTLGVAVYYGLEPEIFYRQIKAESAFRSFAISGKQAIGLGQMRESTAFYIHDKHKRGLLFVPFYNLRLAAKYDLYLLQKFNGNWSLSLAAYNWGETNVIRRTKDIQIDPRKNYKELFRDIKETYNYIDIILR